MNDVAFTGTMPILRISCVGKARDFYVGFLGFAVEWEHRFAADMPLYMQVARAGLTLHLSEHHGDATPGACVFVPMRGLEAFRAEFVARPYPLMRPGIERLPWGAVLEVTDPFGNRLQFCQRPDDPPPGRDRIAAEMERS